MATALGDWVSEQPGRGGGSAENYLRLRGLKRRPSIFIIHASICFGLALASSLAYVFINRDLNANVV